MEVEDAYKIITILHEINCCYAYATWPTFEYLKRAGINIMEILKLPESWFDNFYEYVSQLQSSKSDPRILNCYEIKITNFHHSEEKYIGRD